MDLVAAMELLLLFAVSLGVCGVILLRHNAPSVSMDILRGGWLPLDNHMHIELTNISDVHFDKETDNVFNIYNEMYNATSEYRRHSLDILQEYTPANYLTQFRNPCWYDFNQIPVNALEQIRKCGLSEPINSSEAKLAIEHIENSRNRKLHCFPSFFIPGFPKSGTTTLHAIITQHPLVAEIGCKQCGFWPKFVNQSTDLQKRAYILQYIRLFSQFMQNIESNHLSIAVDATVTSMHTKSSNKESILIPTFIMRVLPEAKFIVIMRNPSERYISHYWFKKPLRKNKIKYAQYVQTRKALDDFQNYTVDAIMKFQSCVSQENSAFLCTKSEGSWILKCSLYYYHILPWLKVFPRERFLFLRTEDLIQDPFLTLSNVWHFLNLYDFPNAKMVSKNANMAIKDMTISSQTRELLDDFFQPYNILLVKLLSDTRYLWND